MNTLEYESWVAETFRQLFGAKISRNRLTGRRAFESGDYKVFSPRDGKRERRVILSLLEPDEETRARINERIVFPLLQLSRRKGIPAIFAGMPSGDLPLHITHERMEIRKDDNALPESFPLSDEVKLMRERLRNFSLNINTLIIAPNSYVCSSQPVPELYEERRSVLEPYWGRVGYYPVRFDDIVYLSIMRLTERVDPALGLKLLSEAERAIGSRLLSDPIRFTIGNVYVGTSYDFMKRVDYQYVI